MSQSTLHHRPFSPPSEDRALSHFASQPDPADLGSGPEAVGPPQAILLPSHRVYSSETDQEQVQASTFPLGDAHREAKASEPRIKHIEEQHADSNAEYIQPRADLENYDQAVQDNNTKLNTLSLESNQQEEEQLKNMTFSRGHNMTFAKQPDGSNVTTANPTAQNSLESNEQQKNDSDSFAGQNQYRGVLRGQTHETEPNQVNEGGKESLASIERADAIECLI